ncbi:predicted protein [Postia placenta Mad-698-R]|nr:predicted protein [Postia placenta Mad-698-R]
MYFRIFELERGPSVRQRFAAYYLNAADGPRRLGRVHVSVRQHPEAALTHSVQLVVGNRGTFARRAACRKMFSSDVGIASFPELPLIHLANRFDVRSASSGVSQLNTAAVIAPLSAEDVYTSRKADGLSLTPWTVEATAAMDGTIRTSPGTCPVLGELPLVQCRRLCYMIWAVECYIREFLNWPSTTIIMRSILKALSVEKDCKVAVLLIVSEEQLHWAIVVMTEDVEKGKDLPCFQVYDRIYDDAGGKWWYLFSQNVLLGETHRCLGGAYVGTVKECQVGSLKEMGYFQQPRWRVS